MVRLLSFSGFFLFKVADNDYLVVIYDPSLSSSQFLLFIGRISIISSPIGTAEVELFYTSAPWPKTVPLFDVCF